MKCTTEQPIIKEIKSEQQNSGDDGGGKKVFFQSLLINRLNKYQMVPAIPRNTDKIKIQ